MYNTRHLLAAVSAAMLLFSLPANSQTNKEKIEQGKNMIKQAHDSLLNAVQTAETNKEKVVAGATIVKNTADEMLNTYSKISTDTNYVSRPELPLTIKIKNDVAGNILHIRSISAEGKHVGYFLDNSWRETIGLTANYRGLSVAISMNPKKLLKKTSDKEYLLNYYNNSFGLDMQYADIHKFYGRTSLVDILQRKAMNDVRLKHFQVNGYYVLNRKKFSYPAVFTNSYIQKRSAGSFIVAGSFYKGKLTGLEPLSEQLETASTLSSLNMMHFALGCGYAYNLVPNKHWLMHLSVQPSIVLGKRYNLHYISDEGDEYKERVHTRIVDMFGVGRAGVTYFKGKMFYAATGVLQISKVGKDDFFSIVNTKWRVRVSIGKRFSI